MPLCSILSFHITILNTSHLKITHPFISLLKLTPPAVLTLPTGILGIFTVLAIVERIAKLTQSSPQYRPLKSPRHALDIFQWGYFGALLLISSLISTTLARGDTDHDDHEFQTRLLSLPVAVLMAYVATLTLLSLVLNALGVRLPFRFGSADAGGDVKPAVYYIVEDVVAVDGNGGVEYRAAWTARYESSAAFRGMIWTLSVVWMVAFYLLAALVGALVMRVLPRDAVYAVGWAGPFPVAGMMAAMTIWYVKRCLRRERKEEEEEGGEGGGEDGGERVPDERDPLLGRS